MRLQVRKYGIKWLTPYVLCDFSQGYSRIPVYEGNHHNIKGVLYVKDLILVDPDDKVELGTIMDLRLVGILFLTLIVFVLDCIVCKTSCLLFCCHSCTKFSARSFFLYSIQLFRITIFLINYLMHFCPAQSQLFFIVRQGLFVEKSVVYLKMHHSRNQTDSILPRI